MNATDGVHLTSIINKLLQLNKECSFLFHYFPKEGPIVSLNSDGDKFRFRMGIPLTASLEWYPPFCDTLNWIIQFIMKMKSDNLLQYKKFD